MTFDLDIDNMPYTFKWTVIMNMAVQLIGIGFAP